MALPNGKHTCTWGGTFSLWIHGCNMFFLGSTAGRCEKSSSTILNNGPSGNYRHCWIHNLIISNLNGMGYMFIQTWFNPDTNSVYLIKLSLLQKRTGKHIQLMSRLQQYRNVTPLITCLTSPQRSSVAGRMWVLISRNFRSPLINIPSAFYKVSASL